MTHEPDDAPAGTYFREGEPPATPRQRRSGAVAAALLLAAGLFTLGGFLAALAWAAILAVALWPLFGGAAARFPRHRRGLLPAAFVTAVFLVFAVPLGAVAASLAGDAGAVGQWVEQARTRGVPPPAFLGQLPFGDRLVPAWQRELGRPGQLSALMGRAAQGGAFRTARAVGAGALRRLVLLGFTLLALFFLLRDGEAVAEQLRIASRRAFGPAGENVGAQVIRSVHGTVNGLVLVGLGEGALLGVAYAVAGVPHPALFGLVTALLATVPFGAPVAFVAAGLVLAATGQPVAAAVIVALGAAVTFVADHFVRPVLIGGATRLPFLWVLLGILGGVEAWGLVGLFLGPAIMAALVLLWREWVGSQRGPLNPPLGSLAAEGTEAPPMS